jgi:Flp pilus assembly protein TadD
MAAHALTETHPDHGFAWKALGVAHKLLGQPSQALHVLRQAVARLPHDVEGHNNLGILLQEQQQTKGHPLCLHNVKIKGPAP